MLTGDLSEDLISMLNTIKAEDLRRVHWMRISNEEKLRVKALRAKGLLDYDARGFYCLNEFGAAKLMELQR